MDPITAATAAIAILNFLRTVRDNAKLSHAECIRLVSRCEVLYEPLVSITKKEKIVALPTIQKVLEALEYSKKQVSKFLDDSMLGKFDRFTRRQNFIIKFARCNQMITDCCTDLNLLVSISAESRRQQDMEDQKIVLASLLSELKDGFPNSGETQKLRDEIIEQQKTIVQLMIEKNSYSPMQAHETVGSVIVGDILASDDSVAGEGVGRIVGIQLPSVPGAVTDIVTPPIVLGSMLDDISNFEQEIAEERRLREECEAADAAVRLREALKEKELRDLHNRLQNFAFRNHHGRFACATPEGSLTWNVTGVNAWERFKAEILSYEIGGNARIAIKSAHGKYVCAESNGGWVVNRDGVGEWETLTLITHGDGRISLRSCHGGYMRTNQPNQKKIFGIPQPEEICHADSAPHCNDYEKYHIFH